MVAKMPPVATLDVKDADDPIVPDERDRQHSGETLDVEAADPGEPRIDRHVVDRDRLAGRRNPPGDALPEPEADLADLASIEAVRRGERQPRACPVGEIEGAHLDPECLGRAVDDRAHELVPVAGE